MRDAPPLTDAAVRVLLAADTDEVSVRLPPGQLDRRLYEEVNQALTRIGGGGKWNRKGGVHVFPRDPRPELAVLLGSGRMPVNPDKEAAFFRTPAAVADRMVVTAGLRDDDPLVLEPSAGVGDIAYAVRRVTPAQPDCVEVNDDRSAGLRAAGFAVYHGRFQDFAAQCQRRYDAIIMNPPFAEPGDRSAWVTHVELAVGLLAPTGVVIALVPGSFTTRVGARFAALRARADIVEELPSETFKDSGTSVCTVMVEITAL